MTRQTANLGIGSSSLSGRAKSSDFADDGAGLRFLGDRLARLAAPRALAVAHGFV